MEPPFPPDPSVVDYARRLLAHVMHLSTFAQVAQWDAEAERTATALEAYAQRLGPYWHECDRLLRTWQNQVAFERMINANTIARLEQTWSACETHWKLTTGLYDELAMWASMTPNDLGEVRVSIETLKTRKKALQLQKREVSQRIKEVNAESRRAYAEIATWETNNPWRRDIAKNDRLRARTEKDAQLRPHESERDAVERQLTEIEQRLAWLGRFA